MEHKKHILSFLCLMLLFMACSDNPAVRMRYQAEKKFYEAEKLLKDSQLKKEKPDENILKTIAARYRDLNEYCLASLKSLDKEANPVEHRELAELTFRSSTRLSQLYYSTKQYDSSLAILEHLMATVTLESNRLVSTRLNMAKTIQASGDWEKAQSVYNDLIETYYPPVDDTGGVVYELFNLPAHIYRMTTYLRDSLAITRESGNAELYYRKLIDEYPNSSVDIAGRAMLARLYEEMQKWPGAIEQYTALDALSSGENPAIKIKIADIYASGLRQYDKALGMYRDILSQTDTVDSLTYPLLLFKTSIVKMEQKKYDEARMILLDIKKVYPLFMAVTPLAQLTMARSIDMEGNWNRAMVEYALLIEKYPESDEAMSIHLYIADYYKEKGRLEEAEQWYEKAEEFYDHMMVRGAGTLLEAKAMVFKADLYQRTDKPEKTAGTLVDLFDKYPNSESGRRAVIKAARIYRDKLNNKPKADSLIDVLKVTLSKESEGFKI